MIDSFAYFNEQDILFLRLDYLAPHVDKFVIVELDTTFSLYPHRKMFGKVYKKLPNEIKSKIVYEFIEVDKNLIQYTGEVGSIDYKNKSRSIDHIMRNTKMELVKSISKDDYFMMSDIDEIWNPNQVVQAKQLIDNYGKMCWEQDMRSGFIDWKSHIESWFGTKGSTVDAIDQTNAVAELYVPKGKSKAFYENKILKGGWHFTLMGDVQTKTQQIIAKREGPGWERKLQMPSNEISNKIFENKYNSIVKKKAMRVNKVQESQGLDPVLYTIAKKYTGLWSKDLSPERKK